jgi:hypothetical protein
LSRVRREPLQVDQPLLYIGNYVNFLAYNTS